MRVRSSRAVQWHTDEGWEYISPTLHSCVAAADVHEAAEGGRSGAGCVWVSAAWCRRSARGDRTGLVWRVRRAHGLRVGGHACGVLEIRGPEK